MWESRGLSPAVAWSPSIPVLGPSSLVQNFCSQSSCSFRKWNGWSSAGKVNLHLFIQSASIYWVLSVWRHRRNKGRLKKKKKFCRSCPHRSTHVGEEEKRMHTHWSFETRLSTMQGKCRGLWNDQAVIGNRSGACGTCGAWVPVGSGRGGHQETGGGRGELRVKALI